MSCFRFLPCAIVAVMCLLFASRAQAASITQYWDTNGATTGSGNAGGSWGSAFWSTSSTGEAATAAWINTPSANASNAVFSAGTDGTGTWTVDVGTDRNVKNITVEEGNVTLGTSGNILLAGTSTWYAAPGASLTINQGVNLQANLTLGSIAIDPSTNGAVLVNGIMSGAGALGTQGNATLTGANTYTGVTYIGPGVTSVSSLANGGVACNIGQASNLSSKIVFGATGLNATLRYTGDTVAIDRGMTINATNGGTIDVSTPGTNLTLNGMVIGSAATMVRPLTKIGSGTLTLGGAVQNNYLILDVNGGEVDLAKSNGAAVGNATVTTGTLKLTGSGGTQIYDGADVTVNGGAFDVNGRNETIGHLLGTGGVVDNTAAGTAILTVGRSGYSSDGVYTYSGVIQNTGGALSLAKAGLGTLILSGANTYIGSTTVSAGTLALGSAGSINSSSDISVAGGASYDVSAVSSYSLAQTLSAKGTDIANVLGALTATSTTLDMQDLTNLGTLAFGSNLSLDGATLKFDLDGAGSDQIVIAGSATLAGHNVIDVAALSSSSSLLTGDQAYTLLTAGDGLDNSKFSLASTTLTVGSTTYNLALSGDATHEYLGVNVAPVPEPGALTLLAIGILGLIAYVWRKRKCVRQ